MPGFDFEERAVPVDRNRGVAAVREAEERFRKRSVFESFFFKCFFAFAAGVAIGYAVGAELLKK